MDYPKSVPSIGLGPDGKFSDGDPQTGQQPSLDPAVWANAVTDEILAVIRGAGLEPQEGANAQLFEAINARYGQFNQEHIDAENPHGNRYYLKGEADERYPIFADLGGKGLALEGCVNSGAKGQVSNEMGNDWTQGAFHNSEQPTALDNKTAWLASMATQYSQGYSVISKIGTYRSGWQFGASMVFQMTGEANRNLGLWEMRQDGAFISKHLTLNKTVSADDFSRVVFEKKNPSAVKQVLGAITWDSFRDVSPVSNVAAIWAEGAGEAANWGELHFGVTTNGDGNLPTKIMSISNGRVLTSQLHTYYLKSSDPAGNIADKARDYDGVSTLLRWNQFGNGHVIFDASASSSPIGTGVSNIDAHVGWLPGYPVLMGSNGVDTFGVRVDAARYAEGMADGSFGVPTGVPQPWPQNTPPPGWVFMQGQGINPAEAPILASLYGATLPDLRGVYVQGGRS
jgi:Phage Tail Collar Domain